MLLRNKSPHPVELRRGVVDEDLGVAVVLVETVRRLGAVGGEELLSGVERKPTDPPSTALRLLWRGVSVTASGTALGPDRAPFVRPVVLRVGGAVRRLIVFGDRRWKRRAGGVETGAPTRFDAIRLGFERAFGGGFDVPPGVEPGTDLPHPGYRCVYEANPGGVGFYASAQAAVDQLLPNVERPDQLVHGWSDRPEPAGFSPCPELYALRLQGALRFLPPAALAEVREHAHLTMLHTHHHAANDLIFPDVPTGERIALEGLGTGPRVFSVPSAPTTVVLRSRKKTTEIAPVLRSIHVDADADLVRSVHAHSFKFAPSHAPDWVVVSRR